MGKREQDEAEREELRNKAEQEHKLHRDILSLLILTLPENPPIVEHQILFYKLDVRTQGSFDCVFRVS